MTPARVIAAPSCCAKRSILTSTHHDAYHVVMRTTLQIDDDVLRTVKSLAAERGQSAGKVISDLVRQALRPKADYRRQRKIPVFEVRENAPIFGPDDVQEGLDD
mgnify:CR=1 FL=1